MRANKVSNTANLDLGFQSFAGSRMAYRAVLTGNFIKAREPDRNIFTSSSNRGHKELSNEIIVS